MFFVDNCSFSSPNQRMKMPENGNNLSYPVSPHQRFQHTYATSPLFHRNNKRKIRPQRQESFPFNGFPGASANMRPCSPCGWNVHSNNVPELFRHCDRNGMPMTRMPYCNAQRFNCLQPHSEYDKYPDSIIHKEQESPRNYVKVEPEEYRLEWNNFANDASNNYTYISNNITPNETMCDFELQNDKFLSNICDDNISYKQCPREDITIIAPSEETSTKNIFNDFSTTERVPERASDLLHFNIDYGNQKTSTLPSELEKAYETMDENALAVYFLKELYPSSPQAVNQVLGLSSTKPKIESNGIFNEITEQINCLNAKENNEGQLPKNSESKVSVVFGETSGKETPVTNLNASTVQEVEKLSGEECLYQCEKKHPTLTLLNASNENEQKYFEENNQKTSRHVYNPRLSERFYECEDKQQTVRESCCLRNSSDQNKISKKNIFNKQIKNINEQNRNCIHDSNLCFDESTKFLDGINYDKLNSGKLSCVKKVMALTQIGLTEELKINERRCDQNSNSQLSKRCMHNPSDSNDSAIAMDITSKLPQLSLRKSEPVKTLVEPNANSSRSKIWKKPYASKQTPTPNSISNTENLSSKLNSKSDANFLSTQNFITQLTPNNAGVPLNATNTEVKESEFPYSSILDLVSPVETSLSSVTNYLLQEPCDYLGNKVSPTLDHYDGSTASYATSENAKCSRKKQKDIKRRKSSNFIQISLSTHQKRHDNQEVINSSITLLDNIFESDIDEYLDFELRYSRKGKIKGKKEERKYDNKTHEKLPSPATQMSSPEKLKYEAEDFKSDKLNRDSRKFFNNALTQTSPMGTANNCHLLKRDAQTQWNISDAIFNAPENLKVEQKVFQSQYQLSSCKNYPNENSALNKDNSRLESNYDSRNLRSSQKKSMGVSKASVKSDSDNSTNENSETNKNISTTTFKKLNAKRDRKQSLDVNILDSVKTCSEMKNLSEENANCDTTDETAGGGTYSRLRIGNGNLNENIKNEQSENAGNPNEKKFMKKANKQIGSGNDTEEEIKEDVKCGGISSKKVSAPVEIDHQMKKQTNEEQKPNLRVRKEGPSLKKSLKSPDSQPIAHRLRQRNKRKMRQCRIIQRLPFYA